MALRIKSNVDLKELEKYGIEYVRIYGCYYKELNDDNELFLEEENRILEIYRGAYNETFKDLDTLYDLIKADLVEKVGE